MKHLKSLREYIDQLKAIGEIQEIDAEVDWDLEMGAIIRRSYELRAPAPLFNRIKGIDDGFRVLVDRVWPRGLSKDAARLDEWAKDAAPSAELRVWYRHDPARFDEFRQRYAAELAEPGKLEAVSRLRTRAESGPLTLLTATRELDLSQAAILAELLTKA